MNCQMRGISLLELMITLAIISIFLAIALPGANDLIRTQHRAQGTNQLLSTLHFARTSAVLSRRTVGICSGKNTCNNSPEWRDELLIFVDSNLNGKLDEGEELLRREPLHQEHLWRWDSFQQRSHLLFEADGTTRALNGTFTLCHGSKALNVVVVNLIGRVRTQSPSAQASCS